MEWTQDRVKNLKEYWEEGLTASQIAQKLGGGVSRNAVIGKVHRLSLPGRRVAGRKSPSVGVLPKKSTLPALPSVRRKKASKEGTAWKEVGEAKKTQSEDLGHIQESVVETTGERITILHLRENMCRWPHGEPQDEDFHFCGQTCAEVGGVYCLQHLRKAHSSSDRGRGLKGMERKKVG